MFKCDPSKLSILSKCPKYGFFRSAFSKVIYLSTYMCLYKQIITSESKRKCTTKILRALITSPSVWIHSSGALRLAWQTARSSEILPQSSNQFQNTHLCFETAVTFFPVLKTSWSSESGSFQPNVIVVAFRKL